MKSSLKYGGLNTRSEINMNIHCMKYAASFIYSTGKKSMGKHDKRTDDIYTSQDVGREVVSAQYQTRIDCGIRLRASSATSKQRTT